MSNLFFSSWQSIEFIAIVCFIAMALMVGIAAIRDANRRAKECEDDMYEDKDIWV
jgi:hypothetical protein